MQRATDLFLTTERQQVAVAVAAAERGTSAEIVPVIVSSSGRYDRPEDIVGLWFAILALAVAWWYLPGHGAHEQGSWSGQPAWVNLATLIGATVAGFIVGAVIGSRVAGLRRLFTPRKQMQAEVRLRAAQVFCDSRVQRTAGGNGLMIYYSLFEGMAVVMADEIVQHKLGQPAIDKLSARLTADLRKSSVKGSLMAAITAAGEQLAPVMPRESADVNELSDRMIVLD